MQVGKHSDALRMALKLGNRELAEQAFANCAEPFYKKQVGGRCSRQRVGVLCSASAAAFPAKATAAGTHHAALIPCM